MVRHGDTDFSKLVNSCPVKKFSLISTPAYGRFSTPKLDSVYLRLIFEETKTETKINESGKSFEGGRRRRNQ